MRIMAYNIYEGGVGRIDPIAEVIRLAQPDVVVLPEANERTEFEKLARRLSYDHFMALEPNLQSGDQQRGGVGLLSRLPIRQVYNIGAVDRRLTRAGLCATLQLAGGKEVTVIGVHLCAGETWAQEAIRKQELPAILELAQQFCKQRVPLAILGDFNAHHPQQPLDVTQLRPKTRERIAGQNNQLPREVVGEILRQGFVDTHCQHLGNHPEKWQTSLNTRFPALRVDYIFVPGYLADCVAASEYPRYGIAKFASDHYPVVADLRLEDGVK